MKIIKTFNWNRRDFSATLECENCQHQQTHISCYDDDHFHQKVVPTLVCYHCSMTGEQIGAPAPDYELKYSPNQIV